MLQSINLHICQANVVQTLFLVNSMIISRPKLNLNISILLLCCVAQTWTKYHSLFYSNIALEEFQHRRLTSCSQWCWYLWTYAGANMTARHNVYIFHCFTTLHPQGGLMINKLLLLGKLIILYSVWDFKCSIDIIVWLHKISKYDKI